MINDILIKSFNLQNDIDLTELLTRKLESTGLSKTQFEKLGGIQRRSLDGILNRTSKQTDIINLLKLGEFLELDFQDLLVIYFKYRPTEEIKELQNSIEITFLNKFFDLKTLTQLSFINKDTSLEELKSRVCNFFQLKNIYEYEKVLNEALYSRTKKTFSDKMKDFWIKSSYKYFELINNPNDYSRNNLVKLIPKIKPYTINVGNGLIIVFRALYNVGVTVVFQPKVPKTQIRGATFVINNKPCIVITDLNQNYATIWFALIHELHHVLFDLEDIKETTYHLTGEPDLFLLQEDKANKFAAEYLISEEKMRYIEPMIHNELMVSRFAEKCQVHPSIIYAQFQFRQHKIGNNYWPAFKEVFPNIENLKKNLNVSNWDITSLDVAANKIKQILTV
ncbi:MAG: ImmA/IrrE family metallo-endopeptidase [Draconibacterium sp.]|nr:ImmA/IrrE family metallo-endopeptidase [Draconibacterium sp.]